MRFKKMTKDGLRKWRWQFAVRQLRTAHEAARSSIDDDLRRINKEHDKFRGAPKPDPDDYDEVASHGAWEDNLIILGSAIRPNGPNGKAIIAIITWPRVWSKPAMW